MTGKPNTPIIFEIVCEVTSANVQWISSFDGGNMQTFTVTAMYGQYKKIESNTISDKGENRIHSAYIQNLNPLQGTFSMFLHGTVMDRSRLKTSPAQH